MSCCARGRRVWRWGVHPLGTLSRMLVVPAEMDGDLDNIPFSVSWSRRTLDVRDFSPARPVQGAAAVTDCIGGSSPSSVDGRGGSSGGRFARRAPCLYLMFSWVSSPAAAARRTPACWRRSRKEVRSRSSTGKDSMKRRCFRRFKTSRWLFSLIPVTVQTKCSPPSHTKLAR